MQHTDVLIVGGGVIGLTTAYYLSRRGLTVKVLDRGVLGAEASWAGAGIVPPGNPDKATTPMDRLRGISSDHYPLLTQELLEISGVDNGYRVCGGIEFLEPNETEFIGGWQHEGIDFESLDPAAMATRFPMVQSPTSEPYYFPKMAQVRNPWHLKALISACMVKRVHLRPKMGFAIFKPRGDQIIGVRLTNWETLSANHYVLASGAWSSQLLADLEVSIPVKPVRGQIVLFRPDQPIFSAVFIHGKRYLVPREDGRVLAGSTEEPEAGFEKQTTEAGVKGLTDFARKLVPDLHKAEIETSWAGLRPGTPDGIPYLGLVPGYRNLFVATGHFRSGIQLSPGTAQVLTELIMGETPSVSMDYFRLDRPRNTGFTPAFRS